MANPDMTSTIYTRRIMAAAKSKIIVIAAIAASLSAPVFAQSLNRSDGTVNEYRPISGRRPACWGRATEHTPSLCVRERCSLSDHVGGPDRRQRHQLQ